MENPGSRPRLLIASVGLLIARKVLHLFMSAHLHALHKSPSKSSCLPCCRLWNTVNGSMVHSVHTGSQICGLAWSESVNELLSTHGYADNAIHLWKAPNLNKIGSLKGHTRRALYLAMSPDGQTAATGAGNIVPFRVSTLSGSDKPRSLNSSHFCHAPLQTLALRFWLCVCRR